VHFFAVGFLHSWFGRFFVCRRAREIEKKTVRQRFGNHLKKSLEKRDLGDTKNGITHQCFFLTPMRVIPCYLPGITHIASSKKARKGDTVLVSPISAFLKAMWVIPGK
jgi:hypothetical protein